MVRRTHAVPFLFHQLLFLPRVLSVINPEHPFSPTSLDPGVLDGAACLLRFHILNMEDIQNEIIRS